VNTLNKIKEGLRQGGLGSKEFGDFFTLVNFPCKAAAICAPIITPGIIYTTNDQGIAEIPPASMSALICTSAQATQVRATIRVEVAAATGTGTCGE